MHQKQALIFCLSLLFVTIGSFWFESLGDSVSRNRAPRENTDAEPVQPSEASAALVASSPEGTSKSKDKGNKPTAGNNRIFSFYEAKKYTVKIYEGFESTFYCGCRYRNTLVDHQSCGYTPETDTPRAYRIEWEHIVPASNFGRSFASWRQGDPRCKSRNGKAFKGRRCARLVSAEFNSMEADLYNLVPAIGEMNSRRGALPMVATMQHVKSFGRCQTLISDEGISPRPAIRGFIARTYKYMDAAYPGHGIISRKNKKLFDSWDRLYPPDATELTRAARILQIQGNPNPFIEQAAKLQAGN